jgi:hypothetical protein
VHSAASRRKPGPAGRTVSGSRRSQPGERLQILRQVAMCSIADSAM